MSDPRQTLWNRFRSRLESAGGVWHESVDDAGLSRILKSLLPEGARVHVSPVLQRPLRDGLESRGCLVQDLSSELDATVTGIDWALAETGSLVHIAKPEESRRSTLIAPLHVAVVRPDRVLGSFEDLFEKIGVEIEGGSRSCVTFITGPSRTADIEQVLTLGVHGPHRLHVVLAAE